MFCSRNGIYCKTESIIKNEINCFNNLNLIFTAVFPWLKTSLRIFEVIP